MKFHSVEMQGTLLTEKVSTLPSWSSADEGRLLYADDVNKFYYGTNAAWAEVGSGSGGGSSLPLILPKNCSLDDTDTDVSRGSAFNMVDTLDFGPTALGTVWFTFEFPSTLDDSKDIDLKLVYNLSGSDDSETFRFQVSSWSYASGETPGAAQAASNNDISTGTSEDGKRQSETLAVIPNSILTAGDTVTLMLSRRSINPADTYTGTLQMLYIYMSQTS